MLGLTDEDASETGGEAPRRTASGSRSKGRAMLKARMKAAQEGRPPPQWGPPSAAEQAALDPLLPGGQGFTGVMK